MLHFKAWTGTSKPKFLNRQFTHHSHYFTRLLSLQSQIQFVRYVVFTSLVFQLPEITFENVVTSLNSSFSLICEKYATCFVKKMTCRSFQFLVKEHVVIYHNLISSDANTDLIKTGCPHRKHSNIHNKKAIVIVVACLWHDKTFWPGIKTIVIRLPKTRYITYFSPEIHSYCGR